MLSPLSTGSQVSNRRRPAGAGVFASDEKDSRDGLLQSVQFAELFRAEPGSVLDLQGFYVHIEEIEMSECVPQQKAVMAKTISS